MTFEALYGLQCQTCGGDISHHDYRDNDGECPDCIKGTQDSYETDGLGMGEWHDTDEV